MNRLKRIIYFLIFLFCLQSPSGQQAPHYYKSLYRQAEILFYEKQSTDQTDSLALAAYLQVIGLHPGPPDSILWDSYYKSGILLQTAGKFEQAIPYLKKAITIQPAISSLKDSLAFLPNLYLGNSYYSISYLDSAVYYFKRAEFITRSYTEIRGIERLYNTLGAVSYESGDYRQSKIYFEKALQEIISRDPGNTALVVNYKNNLASSLRQLNELDSAMSIFKSLLAFNINQDELLHNIGSIYLELGNDSMAINYLHKVKYYNQNKLNDLALAYHRMGSKDSAEWYLLQAFELNDKVNGKRKNLQQSVSYKYRGDIQIAKNNFDAALSDYHAAVMELVFGFNDSDVHKNPVEFSGQYSVIELFESLSAKAGAFELKYEKDKNIGNLYYCIDAYRSLYALTDYAIKTYQMEEAKLFLNKRRHHSHNEPIDVSLKLFRLTGKREFLEQAFEFDEKNKATVLALQVQESGSRKHGGIPSELLQEERRMKQNITRLALKAREAEDSDDLETIQNNLREKQIGLVTFQKKFDEFPSYKKMKFIDNTVSIKDIQEIVPDNAAILSYHIGDTVLLGFCITNKTFNYFTRTINPVYISAIRELNNQVQKTDENQKELIDSLSKYFYGSLIGPVENYIEGVKRLMIIPDDELASLPFQILKNENGDYLFKKHDINFNYSCTVLKQFAAQQADFRFSVLAMAPYSDENNQTALKSLPASRSEVENIIGDKLFARQATKNAFLSRAPSFSIIHLATHAVANDKDPQQSYISFYPQKDSSDLTYNLYSPEIEDLSLDSARLIILSACETGTGVLERGEGLMSLTRAFSYAGCPNTIASLWKADDISTAKISQHLHDYLKEGKTAAESLRLATLDYLEDDNIPMRLKTPAHWAHLRLVGIFEKKEEGGRWMSISIIAAGIMLALIIFYLSRKRSSV